MSRLHLVASFALAVVLAMSGRAWSAEPLKRVMAWDIAALYKAPAVHPTDKCAVEGMKSFFFEGADYKGKPTWVYAYYSAPEGTPPAGGWPAAVCAHGGGGTAYPDWVRTWNKHGYAAISMDLEGHLPDGNSHENAGPSRIDWAGDIGLPDAQQWFYHATADVIRANSLLRSMPGIDPNRIGLTGISWGGTIVSAVAGIDERFAFVVPVYGCGFIHESTNKGISHWCTEMTPAHYKDYCTKWDPSIHLPYAKMPVLWMTGFDDPVFPIGMFERSAAACGGKVLRCYRGHMVHGHGVGWQKQELYVFADSIVKGGQPLPELSRPEMDPKTRIVRVKTKGKLVGASLFYTASTGPWQRRAWENIPCQVRDGEAVSRQPLPAGATAYNVNAKDDRGTLTSSEIVIEPAGK